MCTWVYSTGCKFTLLTKYSPETKIHIVNRFRKISPNVSFEIDHNRNPHLWYIWHHSYCIYLVKRHGYYYLSPKNQCGDYSNSTTGKMIFQPLFPQSVVGPLSVATIWGTVSDQVNTVCTCYNISCNSRYWALILISLKLIRS